MKKLTIVLTIVFTIVLLLSVAELKAASQQSIQITVTCIGTVSLYILDTPVITTNWTLSRPFGTFTNRGVPSIISNDGNVTEDLSLQLDSKGILGSTGWTNSVDDFAGIDEYVLQGLVGQAGSVQPGDGVYVLNDVITETQTTCSAAIFGDVVFSENGTGITPNQKRDLWLKLTVPTGGVQNPDSPTIECIVTATPIL